MPARNAFGMLVVDEDGERATMGIASGDFDAAAAAAAAAAETTSNGINNVVRKWSQSPRADDYEELCA